MYIAILFLTLEGRRVTNKNWSFCEVKRCQDANVPFFGGAPRGSNAFAPAVENTAAARDMFAAFVTQPALSQQQRSRVVRFLADAGDAAYAARQIAIGAWRETAARLNVLPLPMPGTLSGGGTAAVFF